MIGIGCEVYHTYVCKDYERGTAGNYADTNSYCSVCFKAQAAHDMLPGFTGARVSSIL